MLQHVRTEPGALLECDGAVTRKEHEHECIKLRGTHGVRRIPHCWHLVVDQGEEVVHGKVPWELGMVVDILRLYNILRSFAVNRRVVGTYPNENLLCPFAVCASVCNIVRKLAEHIKWLGWGGGRGSAAPMCYEPNTMRLWIGRRGRGSLKGQRAAHEGERRVQGGEDGSSKHA